MKSITQHQLTILLDVVNAEAHNPNRQASHDDLAAIYVALTEASLASGPMLIVGEASYQELEACLDEATPRSDDEVAALESAVREPVGYTVHRGGWMSGPFADLRELREDMTAWGFTAEQVDVGPWRPRLAVTA